MDSNLNTFTKLVVHFSHCSNRTSILLNQKWDGFEMVDVSMKNVSLELHKAVMHRRKGKSKSLSRSELSDDEDVRTLVQFEIDSIPGKRPFLLSKDFAYIRQSGTEDTPFKV